MDKQGKHRGFLEHETILYDIMMVTQVVTCLSKPTECMTPSMSHDVSYRLWVTMMCGFGSLIATNLDSGECGRGHDMGNLCNFGSISVKLKLL